jgi:paraquat-inducible protein A
MCGLVSRAHDGARCPRCGVALHARKPHAIGRAWALSIAAAVLYVPANIDPILIVSTLGQPEPSTILSGVHDLWHHGMWPLALVVFGASVAVPIMKLLGLGTLLAASQRRSAWRRRERTALFRMVEFVGRWSMIDVFMVSLLVALVQFGATAAIAPGRGAAAFAAVVILTMLAAECFDPRSIWDGAEA